MYVGTCTTHVRLGQRHVPGPVRAIVSARSILATTTTELLAASQAFQPSLNAVHMAPKGQHLKSVANNGLAITADRYYQREFEPDHIVGLSRNKKKVQIAWKDTWELASNWHRFLPPKCTSKGFKTIELAPADVGLTDAVRITRYRSRADGTRVLIEWATTMEPATRWRCVLVYSPVSCFARPC